MSSISDLSVFADGLRRERRNTLLFAGFLLLLGVVGVLVLSGDIESRKMAKAVWGAYLCLAVGAGFLAKFFLTKKEPKDTPFGQAILNRPDEIVWIYKKVDGGKRSMVIGTGDGKRLKMTVTEEHENQAFDLLAGVAPHATLGFSADNDAAFRRDPQQLRTR